MYRNIGRKVKGLARFTCILGMIVSIALGALIIFSGPNAVRVFATYNGMNIVGSTNPTVNIITGVLVIILGCLISWIGSWPLYALGEAADK